ncbi:MAG: hypothetical protein ACI4AH_07385 [Muribaculaceae bacterium]
MIKNLLSFITVAAFAVAFGSCNSNDHEQTMSVTDQVLVTTSNGVSQTTTAGKIYLKMDITNSTVDVTMPVQNGSTTTDATFKDLKLSFSSSLGYTFSASKADAVDASGKSLGFSISNLSGSVQVISDSQIEGNIAISYTINGNSAFATKKKISHFITTTITNYGSGTFECKDATYVMTLNPDKGTANIEINNIQFIQQMPTLSEITIPGTTFEATSTGYHLTADLIVPTSADVPMDNRTITNLNITINAGAGTFSGTFNCMGMECTVTGSISCTTE